MAHPQALLVPRRREASFVSVPLTVSGAVTFADGGATIASSTGHVQAPASVLDPVQGGAAFLTKMLYASNAVPAAARWLWWGSAAGTHRISTQPSSGAVSLTSNNGAVSSQVAIATTWAANDILLVVAQWVAAQLRISIGGAFTTAARTGQPTIPQSQFDIGTQDGAPTSQIASQILGAAFWTGVASDPAAIGALLAAEAHPRLYPSEVECSGVWFANGPTMLIAREFA